jgi:hypothetical protein
MLHYLENIAPSEAKSRRKRQKKTEKLKTGQKALFFRGIAAERPTNDGDADSVEHQ